MGNVSQFKRRGFREGTGESCYYGTSYEDYRRPFRITKGMVWFYVAFFAAGIAYGIVAVL